MEGGREAARERASKKMRAKFREKRGGGGSENKNMNTKTALRCCYGVATISRLLKFIGLFCKIAL